MNEKIQQFLSEHYESHQIVVGQIIRIGNDGIWVDVGLDELVNIPPKFIPDEKCDRLNIGETFEILVSRSLNENDNYEPYLDIGLLPRLKIEGRINQLLKENLTIYAEVIAADSGGISIEVESKTFTISNLHLSTDIPNQDLVGKVIPVKIVASYSCVGQVLGFSHRWAVTSDRKYRCGDNVVGKVVEIESDRAWIDLDIEKLVEIQLEQIVNPACYPNTSISDLLTIGRTYEFVVDLHSKNDNDYGVIILSLKTLGDVNGRYRVDELYREDITIYAEVIDKNELGLFVIVESFLGFIPHFHLDPNLKNKDLIGHKLPLKIISFICYGNFWSLIFLSNIYAIGKSNLQQENRTWDVITGEVKEIAEDGVLVDIGLSKSIYMPIDRIAYIPDAQYCCRPIEEVLSIKRSIYQTVSIREILKTNYRYKFVVNYDYDVAQGLDISLSLAKISHRNMWKRLHQYKQEKIVVSGQVIKMLEDNFLVVDVEGAIGFVELNNNPELILNKTPEQLINQKLDLEIVKEYDPDFLILKLSENMI